MAVRLIQESEQWMGLDFFSSGHFRRCPPWTKHSSMLGVSPTFTQWAVWVRREAAMRTQKTTYSLMCLSRGQDCCQRARAQEFYGWTKKLGNALKKLFCCGSIKKEPLLKKIRVTPQKCTSGTAQVHLCFILPRLLCAGSSNVSGLHFPKIALVFHSVSTLWFLLHPNTSPSSGLLFTAGT